MNQSRHRKSDTMNADQTRHRRKPHENRWLATAVAAACVATAAAAPWWNQLIVWLAASATAGVVSQSRRFGGPVRTMAHLSTGFIVMLTAAAIAGIAGTDPGQELFMRAVLLAMNTCAAADVLLLAWLGRGIAPDIDAKEPSDDGADQR